MAKKRKGLPGSCAVCCLAACWILLSVVMLIALPSAREGFYRRSISLKSLPKTITAHERWMAQRYGTGAAEDETGEQPTLWTLEMAESAPSGWLARSRMLVERNRRYLATSRLDEPATGRVTLVSGLFDLGRGELDNAFKRPFSFYVERFEVFLRYQHPKVIFVEERHWEEHYRALVDKYHTEEYPIHVIFKSVQQIEEEFPHYAAVQAIRTSPDWAAQTGVGGWLSQSPQATLRLYNPMVMSKIYWTRDVAQLSPFGTDSFMWIDGGHNCNDPDGLKQEEMKFFQKQMFDRLMITYFDYQPAGEIHGFEKEAFFRFTGVENIGRETEVIVGRGGIFGGTRQYLEVATLAYDEMLAGSLAEGFMGTEENIFALLWYRTPELVHRYDNKEGGNCAVFSEAVHGPPEPPIVWEEYVLEVGYFMRGAECIRVPTGIHCYDGARRLCPPHVTPLFLAKAEDQYACQLRKEFFCTIECFDDTVLWYAHSCQDADSCPPREYLPVPYGSHIRDA
mmetsp:Transcript_9922/g.40189  ORF Transcript_9922/g.40189 Transcript_9922/m.40189 type:complete len:508 (+) Transcript_9922:147-1670(+)